MKFLALLLVTAGFCFADQFYSQTAFNKAIGNRPVLTDSFADGKANIPGVSVTSITDFGGIHPGNGHFAPGMYVDTQGHYTLTTWIFSNSIYAFGGDWNMPMKWPGPGSDGGVWSGLSIILGNVDPSGGFTETGEFLQMPDGVVPPWTSYNNPQQPWPITSFSGFWGFTSSTPFSVVAIEVGDEGPPSGGNFAQYYEFTNLQITTAAPGSAAATPEPASVALLLAGAAILGLLAERRRQRA